MSNKNAGPTGGGYSHEMKTIRIDKPTSREERRALNRAERRGGAQMVAGKKVQQALDTEIDSP